MTAMKTAVGDGGRSLLEAAVWFPRWGTGPLEAVGGRCKGENVIEVLRILGGLVAEMSLRRCSLLLQRYQQTLSVAHEA